MKLSLDVLGPDTASAVARLCQAALGRHSPEPADIAQGLFDAPPGLAPPVVRGDPAVGVVASVRREDEGYIRLLAVHPDHRRAGVGTALMRAAEADLLAAGCSHATVGTDAPDYLFAGVPTELTEMFCLMEALGYQRRDANLNMGVDLTTLPADPGGTELATAAEEDEVRAWTGQHWAWWTTESLRALHKDRLLISRDAEGVIDGVCAWDVNRGGWLGPIAVKPAAMGGRVGVPLLLGALHRMRADGRTRAEISWISPVRFYARNGGARISDVFIVHRRRIAPRDAAPTEGES